MTPQPKPRKNNLLVACFVVLAILILLLRLFVFVHGHGRRTFRTAKPTSLSMAFYHPSPAWTGSFSDGIPDFLRLTDPAADVWVGGERWIGAGSGSFYVEEHKKPEYQVKVVNPGRFAISPAQAGPVYQSNIQTPTDPATLEVQQ